jgi:hypothetical protein
MPGGEESRCYEEAQLHRSSLAPRRRISLDGRSRDGVLPRGAEAFAGSGGFGLSAPRVIGEAAGNCAGRLGRADGLWRKADRYSRLPSGLIVKTGSLRCPSLGAVNCPSNGGNPTDGSCRKDTDCVAGLNGYCGRVGLAVSCSCHYGCFEDAECAQGEACVCNGVRGQCVPAPCLAGGCKEGTCSTYFDGDKYHPFACRTETGPMGPVQ